MSNRLKNFYKSDVVPKLRKTFHYKNEHEIPAVIKIVVNRGLGQLAQNDQVLQHSVDEIATITGQRPIITKARKAIAAFKIKERMPVGVSVTLRGMKMYNFLDRLTNLALPRIRDFQGISETSFDNQGNYNLGLDEQLMFPEIEYDKLFSSSGKKMIQGMDIAIVTTAKTPNETRCLLESLGIPFQNTLK
jgi:large subunit ribosomal protein L5